MKKICIVSTVGVVINSFMLKHIKYLKQIGSIVIIVGDDSSIDINKDIEIKRINIDRKVNIAHDLRSLYELTRYFKSEGFHIVLSLMPKSGLLSMLASYLAKVSIRIHIFTGQVWATKVGISRVLLKYMDKVLVVCSTKVLIDSHVQKQFLINEGILPESKGFVLNKGSISGVNMEKFKLDRKVRQKLRCDYNISDGDIVFMFLGRINKDKGVLDLCEAFLHLFDRYSNIKLIIVGPVEDTNIVHALKILLSNVNVSAELQYCNTPEIILNIADILVLPSHREGFGTIVIEAAAMNIPTIGSDIYGLKDSIVNNKSGLLHNVYDVKDMISKYSMLIDNRKKIKEYGDYSFDRVKIDFNDELISLLFLEFIKQQIINI